MITKIMPSILENYSYADTEGIISELDKIFSKLNLGITLIDKINLVKNAVAFMSTREQAEQYDIMHNPKKEYTDIFIKIINSNIDKTSDLGLCIKTMIAEYYLNAALSWKFIMYNVDISKAALNFLKSLTDDEVQKVNDLQSHFIFLLPWERYRYQKTK